MPHPAEVDDRLQAHLRSWLGAWPPARPVHVVGSVRRTEPGWDGAVRVVNGVATPDGAVVSVSPEAEARGRPTITLRLLGGFELVVDGVAVLLPGSTQRLVALLALRGRSGRSRLAGELWPEATETRAMGCLRTAIWRVNQVAAGLVSSTPGAAELDGRADVDVRRLVDSSRALLAGTAPLGDHRASPLDGDLLPDWEDPWLAADRERAALIKEVGRNIENPVKIEGVAPQNLVELDIRLHRAVKLCVRVDRADLLFNLGMFFF